MRPVTVLQMTMDYLAANVMDNGEGRWGEWFNFLWDRTRAIRKVNASCVGVRCFSFKVLMKHIFSPIRLCQPKI